MEPIELFRKRSVSGAPGSDGASQKCRVGAASPAYKSATLERGDPKAPRGWHSRGYLPHFDSPHVIQHVIFHLADSLPVDALTRIEEELKETPPAHRDAERRGKIDAWIDSGKGCCVLKLPEAAGLVQEALLFFDGERYHLFAWVVMPNHVHVVFQPLVGWAVSRIVSSWKSFTGRRLSPLLPRSSNFPLAGPVWHREYWDRYIRDDLDFHAVREYIHQNPVKAGLIQRPEEWVWSSAGRASGVRPPATLERGDPKRSAGLQPGMPLNQ